MKTIAHHLEKTSGVIAHEISGPLPGKKILYITDCPCQQVNEEHCCTEYECAKIFLINTLYKKQSLPVLIAINIAYNQRKLADFSHWLHCSEHFKHIPVIYNVLRVNKHEMQEMQKQHLVDDISLFTNQSPILYFKANFLANAKKASSGSKKVVLEFAKNSVLPADDVLRRLMDISIASALLIVLSPLMLLIGIIIKLTSKGSIFYTAKRAGKGYKTFDFYKFRTMCNSADKKVQELMAQNQYANNEGGPVFFKIQNDPRITKFGAFLRNTSLDELPQLFNVIKGDMSIVGNRPLPLYEASTLTTNDWAERFMAPAGITGLWQVMKRGSKEMSAVERINLDIKYAQQNSLVEDLQIIFKTPMALLQKSNV